MKAELDKLNEQIKFFSKLSVEYPVYSEMLAQLEKQRAELVSRIGHKRMIMRLRSKR